MMADKELYSRSIGELLHEVCTTLIDCQEVLQEIEARRETCREEPVDERQLVIYDYAYEQVSRKIARYHELGDLLDEVVGLCEEINDMYVDEMEDITDDSVDEDDDDDDEEEYSEKLYDEVSEQEMIDEEHLLAKERMKLAKKNKKCKKDKRDKKKKNKK